MINKQVRLKIIYIYIYPVVNVLWNQMLIFHLVFNKHFKTSVPCHSGYRSASKLLRILNDLIFLSYESIKITMHFFIAVQNNYFLISFSI